MSSIRWKLILTSFVVVFLPVYFLNRYAIDAFNRFTSKALEEQMIGHAFMVGEQYRAMVMGPGDGARTREAEFAALLNAYGPKIESRVRVLSPRGVALFDSAHGRGVGEDLSARREVASAMQGRYKARWELSPDRQSVFYYVPLPVLHDGGVLAIVYVTRHTGPIIKAIQRMTRDQRMAMFAALAGAVAISAILASTLTRRLRRLTRAALARARGEGPLDVDIRGRDEIGELARTVTEMAREIEARSRYNREFMSAAVHELRTPITAIRGAAELLADGAGERADARAKFLANIRFEAERLTRLVGELNELTRVDAESLDVRRSRVDYGACMREIVERLLPTFERPRAELSVSIPDEPLAALIAPGRIEQVVSNLLENAFRYTPPDGRVELAVRLDGRGQILTTVRDTGPGIPEANLEKVFDRFFTTERRDVPKDYGSGLGLSIARSIVQNHHGRIWAANASDGGAVISFTLPVAGR